MSAHRPTPGTWDCDTCAEPWPCTERREKFLADYEGRAQELRALMAMFFIDAAEDMGDSVPELKELHDRFVTWSYKATPVSDGAASL